MMPCGLTVYLLSTSAVLSSRGFQTVSRVVSEVRIGRGLMAGFPGEAGPSDGQSGMRTCLSRDLQVAF